MSVDVVFSLDVTGSMYACLGQARKSIRQTCTELFDNIPNLRIGIVAHGDYCDGNDFYYELRLTDKADLVCDFVNEVPALDGGDAPECYEYVLHQTRNMPWRADKRCLVLIGDDVPHEKGYSCGRMLPRLHSTTLGLDWRHEAAKLIEESSVTIYAVQALGRQHATKFYQHLGSLNGLTLSLTQFAHVNDLIKGAAYNQAGKIDSYSKNIFFDELKGRKKERKKGEHYLLAVHPSRFQIIDVESDVAIKPFVTSNGLIFKTGRGFYEWTKTETIQEKKEIVLRDKITGEMFSGDNARAIAGIPVGARARLKPGTIDKYDVFVQSTSNNRKLISGTRFLYEVSDL